MSIVAKEKADTHRHINEMKSLRIFFLGCSHGEKWGHPFYILAGELLLFQELSFFYGAAVCWKESPYRTSVNSADYTEGGHLRRTDVYTRMMILGRVYFDSFSICFPTRKNMAACSTFLRLLLDTVKRKGTRHTKKCNHHLGAAGFMALLWLHHPPQLQLSFSSSHPAKTLLFFSRTLCYSKNVLPPFFFSPTPLILAIGLYTIHMCVPCMIGPPWIFEERRQRCYNCYM